MRNLARNALPLFSSRLLSNFQLMHKPTTSYENKNRHAPLSESTHFVIARFILLTITMDEVDHQRCDRIIDLLRPYDAEAMKVWKMSNSVNNIRNNSPELCAVWEPPTNLA